MNSKAEIVAHYQRSFSTEGFLFMDDLSFIKGFNFEKNIDTLLEELTNEELVTTKDSKYYPTDKGSKTLNKRLASRRYR